MKHDWFLWLITLAGILLLAVLIWEFVPVSHKVDKLKTACPGETSPSWINNIKGVYFYRCPDGSTGYLD